MEERLKYVLGLVNDWLRFAEAKNVATLTAAGVTVFGVLQTGHLGGELSWGKGYLIELVLFMSLGGVVALVSFLPRTSIPFTLQVHEHHGAENLVFFGDAARYTAEQYLRAFADAHSSEQVASTKFEQDLAEQIVINARIANWKYGCFKVSLFLVLSSVVTFVVAGMVFAFAWWTNKPKGSR